MKYISYTNLAALLIARRYLLLPNFSPALSKGRSTVLMRHSSNGWHFASSSTCP